MKRLEDTSIAGFELSDVEMSAERP